jgi:hypothetical protein
MHSEVCSALGASDGVIPSQPAAPLRGWVYGASAPSACANGQRTMKINNADLCTRPCPFTSMHERLGIGEHWAFEGHLHRAILKDSSNHGSSEDAPRTGVVTFTDKA